MVLWNILFLFSKNSKWPSFQFGSGTISIGLQFEDQLGVDYFVIWGQIIKNQGGVFLDDFHFLFYNFNLFWMLNTFNKGF